MERKLAEQSARVFFSKFDTFSDARQDAIVDFFEVFRSQIEVQVGATEFYMAVKHERWSTAASHVANHYYADDFDLQLIGQQLSTGYFQE